ncbi:MAG: L,D-transpeptidase [Clostridium sp.]|nr:L,D-transpeptidase [Clostridium sp.]
MKKLLFTIITTINILFSFNLKAYSLQATKTDNYIIFIDVNELTLSLLKENSKELIKKYPIAMGKPSTPSPIGQWRITSKALKDGPFGGYWLGLNAPWDTFGIHGTSNPASIGSLASNGCIRMYNNNIKELFNLVNYDTRVIVYSGPSWRFSPYNRKININDKGTDVFYVQRALKKYRLL